MKRALTTLLTAVMLVALWVPNTVLAQQNTRPAGADGLTVFETVGVAPGTFDGLKLYWGADFTQQFQALSHENDGSLPLMELGNGFNLATANLNMVADLADGMTVNLVTYLSSRHHAEAWVKGGYLQVDSVPIESLKPLFETISMRVGHMEVNYGDAHFRRTDNGSAIYNPFVGNLIMDSFATEIGAEVYARFDDVMVMVGATGGEIKGRVDRPDDRAPTLLAKVAYDSQVNEDLRVRVAGSMYSTSKSLNNTLYSGDRAGSRFYDVLVEESGESFRNGRYSPGYRSKVQAIQINPFVQFQGLEVHGIYEMASGEDGQEDATQFAVDVLYRMNDFYVGARQNNVEHGDVKIDRLQVALGWFVTPNVLTKINYVTQSYEGTLAEGSFDGITIEGVVSF